MTIVQDMEEKPYAVTWYRTPLDPKVLKQLHRRSDWLGLLQTLGYLAVLAITGQSWFSPIPLCATLVVCHLGLLIWETRYVSATLAYPGLKPRPAGPRRNSAARVRAGATQKGS